MAKRNKYGAKKCVVDGIKFDSIQESKLYLMLRDSEEWIIDTMQEKVYLTEAKILIKPDFTCIHRRSNERVYIESKGKPTPSWNLKKRLWRVYGPGKLLIYGARNAFIEAVCPKPTTS